MRRLLVLLPFIAVVVAVLEGPAAEAEPHSGAGSMIICPLEPSAPGPPCCGPPVMSPDSTQTCCATGVTPQVLPQCCPVPLATGAVLPTCCAGSTDPCSISIAASPNPADGHGQVKVSGSVSGGTVSGVAVALWQEVAGESKFSQVGQVSTDATGAYSITAPGDVKTDRQWYATAGTLQSTTVKEQVAADVTLLVKRGRHSATVRGTVTPSHAGDRVELQRKLRGRWITIAKPKLDRASRFSVRYAGRPRVKATLRAVLPPDSTNMRSLSSTLTAVVLPRVGS
jgi:hypothetical protein